jgi:hypothetical protein
MDTNTTTNTAVKTTIIGFLAEWQGLLYSMRWMITLALVLILADLWFGVSASKHRGEKIRRSRAGRRTFNKIIDYLCYIFIGVTIGKAIAEPYGVDPIITAITAMVLCYCFEIDSIYGHILELHNIKVKVSIWKLLAYILTLRFKQFATVIEDINKQYKDNKDGN